MRDFAEIGAMAEERKGGAEGLEEGMSRPHIDVSKLGDDRLLAEFTKRVFCAGFNWSVIEEMGRVRSCLSWL